MADADYDDQEEVFVDAIDYPIWPDAVRIRIF